jgi:hypothetical protein
VSLAETVCVQVQDRQRFISLLHQAVAFDLNSAPEFMLSNTLAQDHASWLVERADDLFIQHPEALQGGAEGPGGDVRWPIRK